MSPAYFDFSQRDTDTKLRNEAIIDTWIKDRMPEEARENDKVFIVFKMCISAVVYHRQYLDDHLHSTRRQGSNGMEQLLRRCGLLFGELEPYLCTATHNEDNQVSYAKSRQGQIFYRTCYNNMQRSGLLQGNKV